MIKYILPLISALFLFPILGMAEVNFKVQTIQSTLPQAKSEQKLILSVCSSKDCGACKWMDKHVYTDSYLSKTINNKLIPIKPAASLDRMEFLQNCKILPTMIFKDENGKTVQKIEGKKTLEEMRTIVDQVLSTNCTAKGEKLDETLGTHKGSACCEGLVKEVKDNDSICVVPTCIETSQEGIPLKVHPRDTPPCCDDSAEKEVTFGSIGSQRIRCVQQRIFKKIDQSGRDSRKPNFLPGTKKKDNGTTAKPY